MPKRLKNERIMVATRHFYERISGLVCLKNEAMPNQEYFHKKLQFKFLRVELAARGYTKSHLAQEMAECYR